MNHRRRSDRRQAASDGVQPLPAGHVIDFTACRERLRLLRESRTMTPAVHACLAPEDATLELSGSPAVQLRFPDLPALKAFAGVPIGRRSTGWLQRGPHPR